jgi:diacylglycerol kinase (ATP)
MAGPFKRLVNATLYSCAGLRAACLHEPAFRLELLVLVLVTPAGLWLGGSGSERALLIGSWLMVLVVELVNAAIEVVIDRIGPEKHELSGRAKDLGSAAVFCSILSAVAVWVVILLP